MLFRFPPAEYHFYPACPVWTLLHLQCPGCGTTRALAALLHGQLREALRLNALTVCSLPLILAYASARRLGFLGSIRQPALQPSTMSLTLAAAVVAAFTLARNL